MSLTNTRLGPWIVRELIGMGGTAEVYRADNVDGGPPVVIKVFRPERATDPKQAKGFKHEFAILERRLHPSIPVGRRFTEISGRPCIVMDYVPGHPLSEVLAKRAKQPVAPVDPLRVLIDLCLIVQAMHQAELVHNDIKLENCILRADGSLSLVDFGSVRSGLGKNLLAALFRRSGKKVFGTATYLAPELIAGADPTYKSDVYALGICIFRLLTGQFPFEASSMTGRLKANALVKPPTLIARMPSILPGPAAVLDRCLVKDPAERTPTVNAILTALRQLQERARKVDKDDMAINF